MELPNYPEEDPELKNIIDKLAQFVAKNGIEFEHITKQKQRDNPKFNFLSGGEYYNYYQFKLNSERALLRQKGIEQQQQQQFNHHQQLPPNLNQISHHHHPSIPQAIFSQQAPPQLAMPQFNNVQQHQPPSQHQASQALAAAIVATQQKAQSQINELQDQIRQSLENLNAQHQMLNNQQQLLIDDAIRKIQDEKLVALAHDFQINLHEFELVLHPIFETCTKDSISVGKSWISTRCQLPVHYEIVSKYFLKRVRSPGMPDIHKIHLLYLINDLFNHSIRKNIDSLKQALTSAVIPIYCFTFVESNDEIRQRLLKLEKIWDTNNYIDKSIIEQLKNPQVSINNYQQELCNEFSNLVQPITAGTMAKLKQLQQQHDDFVNHQNAKIQQLQVTTNLPPTNLSMPGGLNMSSVSQGPFLSSAHPPFNQPPVLSMMQPNQMLNNQLNQAAASLPPPNIPPSTSIASNVNIQQHLAYVQSQNNIQPNANIFQPANNQTLPSNTHHLVQQPPPQIAPNVIQSQPQFSAQQPDVPYYELPAGLMVPLVKLEDFDYEEIDPCNIRLPLPAPPNERLLRAVEEFYNSHDKPRNQDGWTQLGLYDFYRAKTQAKQQQDELDEMEKQKKRAMEKEGFSIKNSHSRSKSISPNRSRDKPNSSRSSRSRSSRSNSKTSSRHRRNKKRQKRSYSSSASSSSESSDYSSKRYSSDSRSSRSRSSSRSKSYKSSRSSKRYRSHSRSHSPKKRSSDVSSEMSIKANDYKKNE